MHFSRSALPHEIPVLLSILVHGETTLSVDKSGLMPPWTKMGKNMGISQSKTGSKSLF